MPSIKHYQSKSICESKKEKILNFDNKAICTTDIMLLNSLQLRFMNNDSKSTKNSQK